MPPLHVVKFRHTKNDCSWMPRREEEVPTDPSTMPGSYSTSQPFRLSPGHVQQQMDHFQGKVSQVLSRQAGGPIGKCRPPMVIFYGYSHFSEVAAVRRKTYSTVRSGVTEMPNEVTQCSCPGAKASPSSSFIGNLDLRGHPLPTNSLSGRSATCLTNSLSWMNTTSPTSELINCVIG